MITSSTFKREIGQLQKLGEVYYSENFKGIRRINESSMVGTIKSGKYDYFEMDFKIGSSSKGNKCNLKSFQR